MMVICLYFALALSGLLLSILNNEGTIPNFCHVAYYGVGDLIDLSEI